MTPTALQNALLIAGGLLAGFVLAWLMARYRYANRFSKYLVRKSAEVATLTESLRSRTRQVEALQQEYQQTQEELARLNADLLEVSRAHSAALSRLDHLAAVEASLADRDVELARLNALIADLKQRQGELETSLHQERCMHEEKVALLSNIREEMTDTFKAMSAGALRDNNRTFLDLAGTTLDGYLEKARQEVESRSQAVKEIVEPVQTALEKYDKHVKEMECAHAKGQGALNQQLHSLINTQQQLHKETARLVKALRVPHVRGRWGEITLKRVAELAGMQNRCDFFEQQSAVTDECQLRPDMIVRLPGRRQIVVDAKVPLNAYLEALEAESDEDRQKLFSHHLKHIRTHITQLARKTYWKQFHPTPEFVILFIPGENFFSAALAQDPRLIEDGVQKGVVLATPTTLISLLKAVAFGWQQEKTTENARLISDLGRELYTRLHAMANRVDRVGRDIERCTTSYNELVGSLERRVLVSARKFKQMGVSLEGNKNLPRLASLEKKTRKLQEDNA